ncbi:MAG: N-acetylmuramoyl-L-alanine amidase, partial [Candidatus Sulfotelmatobacter sp.]
MATTPTKAMTEIAAAAIPDAGVPSWPGARTAAPAEQGIDPRNAAPQSDSPPGERLRPVGSDALQALLGFSALHQQVRQRRALASRNHGFEVVGRAFEFEHSEQFVLDEVLQLVAERAVVITGGDGLGIALAENNEIVLRASAGTIKPDVGARIQRDSAFSGACFRTAQIIRCDDTETDDRVNLDACRKLGARSMVAVPLCGRRRVIGVLEAFSAEPFGFNDSDVGSLELLAELILGALKPEDEDRFAESARVAEAELTAPPVPPMPPTREAGLSETTQTASVTEATVADSAAEVSASSAAAVDVPEAAATSASIGEPAQCITETFAPQPTEELVPLERHHPGIVFVLILLVVFVLVAGGVWWKLKNVQMGKALVQPAQQTTTNSAARPAARPGNPSGSFPSNPLPGQTGSPSTSGSADVNAPSAPSTLSAATLTPQELAKLARITGIRHWSSADSSTVVLDLQDQVQYEAHRLPSPDRIYFDLHDTSLAPELVGKSIEIGDPLLTRVRVAQPVPGLTRVVLETKGNPNFSVSLETNPYRLVVEVRKPGSISKGEVNLFPTAPGERQRLAIVVPPPTHEDMLLRARVPKMRIVVDAGHGGWDLGTVGRRGLLEKDVVLEIAQRLAKLLEGRLGAEVILTRNDDNYIPLDERAGIANQAQADLFVSVHANYSDLPSARGVETYYTNFFSSPDSKDVETRQDTAANKNGVTATLSPADLHDRIEQSRRLAASVQRSLYGTLSVQNPGLRDRGVREASYVVLTETAMPGILAEVSFVSSPTDEQKLRSEGYREQIAEALY